MEYKSLDAFLYLLGKTMFSILKIYNAQLFLSTIIGAIETNLISYYCVVSRVF